MHRVLQIQEILLNIFGHCLPIEPHWTDHRHCATADLAALARTCRTFKEPALDILWSELVDLRPLPRCVPEACKFELGMVPSRYSFKRQLNEAEWRVLRNYTRRIWHILGYANAGGRLDNSSLIKICSLSLADPLFPNLRTLCWQGTSMLPTVHVAVPSLTMLKLHVTANYAPQLKDFLETIGNLSPKINRFHFLIPCSHDFDEIICGYIRRLNNLEELDCRDVHLDEDTISHLSRNIILKRLSFTLGTGAPKSSTSSSTFVFSTMVYLETRSQSLNMVTQFLLHVSLPAIKVLHHHILECPSKEALESHASIAQSVCSQDSLDSLHIIDTVYHRVGHISYQLFLNDLSQWMTFVHLRVVEINLPGWSIELNDDDLLALVAVWLQIRTLRINDLLGWRTTNGITIRGLSRLLQARPSLSDISIAIRVESYTDVLERPELTFVPPPNRVAIDLIDSVIQPADVPGLIEAFCKIGLHTCAFIAWGHLGLEGEEGYEREWNRVFDGVAQRASEGL